MVTATAVLSGMMNIVVGAVFLFGELFRFVI